MRKSTKYLLLSGVTLAATTAVYLLGMGDALALPGGETIATMSSQTLTKQVGATGNLMKQGANVLGAACAIGGGLKLYTNAKDGFKEGAKGFVVPAVMGLTGGAILAAPFIVQSGAKSIGAQGSETIEQTTGGKVGW